MARFIVEGGVPLRGAITPAGNKNEALPAIAAALQTDQPVTLRNVPHIRDVRNMLEIASTLGAQVEDVDRHTVRITAKDLRTDELPAALAPHVQQLAKLLAAMGSRIEGVGTNTLTIDGVDRLRGADHTLLSDHMEVGSLIAMAAMTHGEVTIKNVVPDHLRMTRLVFRRLGIETEMRGNDVFVPARERYDIEAEIGGAVPEIKPNIWPGFPTDLTSMVIAFATQAHGVVLIHEWMFEARLYWVDKIGRAHV